MNEALIRQVLLVAFFGLAVLTFPFLFFVTAPYGRYTRASWGPTISRRLGWVLMEAPSPLGFALFFMIGDRQSSLAAITFLALWQLHYIHRAFIFPFRMRGDSKRINLATVAFGLCFNLINSYLNGRSLNTFAPIYPATWIVDPRFLGGTALFLIGLAINLHSDAILIHLRQPGDTGYKIPRGGFFRWVSCPNYLGEVLEWSGWALLTWSLAGLAFAVWTTANLVPRAWTHHLWYRQQLTGYPPERRAIFPLLL